MAFLRFPDANTARGRNAFLLGFLVSADIFDVDNEIGGLDPAEPLLRPDNGISRGFAVEDGV